MGCKNQSQAACHMSWSVNYSTRPRPPKAVQRLICVGGAQQHTRLVNTTEMAMCALCAQVQLRIESSSVTHSS
jgi:hypothetical protein